MMLPIIESVVGVGQRTALALLAYVGAMHGFGSHKQLVAYMGLNPVPMESGTSLQAPRHISKQGNARLRTLFYLCALSAKRHNRVCRALYERLKAEGKAEKVALIAVANKLVKQVFTVVKKGVPHQSNSTMNRLLTPFLLWVVVFLCVLPQGGCVRLQQGATMPPILGTWHYTMTHPSQGTITGVMIIQQRPDGTYTGHVSAVEIGIDEVLIVDRLDVDGQAFTMQGWLTGMELILRGTLGDDAIQGTNQVVGMETFTFTAQRAVE